MDASNFFKLSPLVRENLNVALKSIVNNKLRSILTILIIAVGITSLVGILTATSALESEILSGFEKMGTTSFTIAPMYYQAQGETRSRVRNHRIISYRQAKLFKDNFRDDA
ncbi:MAG: ABC transporter permease, partial [Bacteroidales bacterium]|nr:ABC transporter permease [Bacteroidales bacterium]